MNGRKMTDDEFNRQLAGTVIAGVQRGCLDRFQAADYMSCSTRTIDKEAANGNLPRVKLGRKTLFRIADLDRFIASRLERVEVSE